MLRALASVNYYAASREQLTEECGGKFGWVFNSERFVGAGVVERHVAPQRQDSRPGLAVHEEFSSGASRRGDDAVVETVVVGKGRDTDKGLLARTIGGQDVHEDDLVGDGERGNGCAVRPHEIILAPAFTVAFEGEIGVVGDNVAVHILHAFLYEGVGERLQRLNGMIVALRSQVVGKFASGEIGVAVSDQQEISIEPTVTVERGSSFDGGAKLVLRTDQRQCG